MSRRSRPKIEEMDEQVQHSFDHRGEMGKYGNVYKEDVSSWRPKEGDHELCIIPFLVEKNSIFRTKNPDFNKAFTDKKLKEGQAFSHKLTVLLHYSIGVNKDSVLCPRTFKETCPICEERDRLISESDDSKEMQERISALNPSKRAIYNVFVFDSDEEMKKGVQIWEAPHSSIEDVLSELYINRRTGEKKFFTIPEESWNVLFERKGKGLNTEYRQIEILERRKEDEFSEKEMDDLYNQAYVLDDLIEVKTYDELKELFKGHKEEKPGEELEKEERPGREGRFRGRAEEEKPKEEKLVEKEPDDVLGDIPEEYKDCFGVRNNEMAKCEDCPKKIWEECFKICEKKKQPEKRETRERRSLR